MQAGGHASRVPTHTAARHRVTDHDDAAPHKDALREFCHDLLQPAATIDALVAAARVEVDLAPATAARLDQVVGEVRGIVELCRRMVQRDDEHAMVPLHRLTAEVAAAASARFGGTVVVDAAPAIVNGNAVELRRAVSNLIDNALRAAGDDGQVAVAVERDGDVARVRIADTGGGFGSAAPGVAGLGLGIAGRAARQHGGEMTIGRSPELGGAEVTISLPTHGVEVRGPRQVVNAR